VKRGDAYGVLSARLNELRCQGYDALLARVEQPAASETVQVNGEPVVIDVEVTWPDRKRGKLRVCGTASGPSTWMMERLDESFVIGPGTPAAG
jgi:hypothetical protein